MLYPIQLRNLSIRVLLLGVLYFYGLAPLSAQGSSPSFRVLAFYTATHDPAHISFVEEANQWFSQMALTHGFTYQATNDWNKLNKKQLSSCQVVIFLDTRPQVASQRKAFERYMKKGGAWMGFHFAGFALTPSAYAQNWNWYHNEFIGAGAYKSNTWRPTSAVLKVEDPAHPATKHLPATFASAPNEWYSWQNDLRANAAIKILLSIDGQSFPVGTGPKPEEIWHSGYYPVAWTNTDYRMLYINMGHNDIDYENKTNKTLSFTFANQTQNQFIMNALFWLARAKTVD
ncbi:ThuA domain-containing protein [Rhodocytophaga aerolata]|uniref:ThuA domain-containing protein n=1 Tax=Rhodocytophaga aerolata TaxID=455078 RepID=A0ABT8RH17_9BACT|nr:ThuA domain-containing protein [Rhodocytophaga aerolata]MDO1451394.1 ThuA domain-containing protein [Rhodocytophaga aerolata]